MKREQAKGPSQRQLRAGEIIRHALAEIFQTEDIQDPELAGQIITVAEVRLSPDLKHATVFTSRCPARTATQSRSRSTATRNFCAASFRGA